tara:strand:+ start:9341 stop:10324 length:984 start_codon:yes stop_codon:yes gene_type:complete
MATHNYTISNGSGQAVRLDINGALKAVQTTNSNETEPGNIEIGQLWYDISATEGQLRLRNRAGAWEEVGSATGALVGSSSTRVQLTAGTQALPSVYFGTDTTSGFYAPASNQIALSLQDDTYLKIGYNVAPSGSTPNRALFLGNAASLTAPLKPKVVVAAQGVANQGLMVSELGRLQICADEGPPIELNRTNNNGIMIGFSRDGGTPVGHITMTTTTVSYVTGSDYRLKENVIALTGAKSRLQQLLPKKFNFISNPGLTVDGFLAHETQTVVPEAITGTKDEVDSDGNAVHQGIDQSKLVPLLTAALQEAFDEIASLTTRVATLEAN